MLSISVQKYQSTGSDLGTRGAVCWGRLDAIRRVARGFGHRAFQLGSLKGELSLQL
jgi:hypothetical protein